MNKNTFCILPHIHQMIRQDGTISLCCTAIDLGLQMDNPVKAWNSDYIKDVREALNNGKRIKQCQLCWDREDKGFRSMRQDANKEYGTDPKPLTTPKYLDLRLSNLCNLKCRMCNPVYSSQIAKEYNTVDDEWSNEFVIETERQFLGEENNLQEVKPIMWNKLKSYIPGLEKIYFTGGEPTLVPQVKEYLQLCIDTGYANHINLVFTTNATNINKSLIELCNNFHNVHWATSIDAYGSLNNYIRSNSNWEIIDKNLKLLLKTKHSISINPTVCIYNILEITKLLTYAESLWNQQFIPFINLNLLQTPNYLGIQHLSKNLKLEAIKKLEHYSKTSNYIKQDKAHSENIYSIITYLKKPVNNEKQGLIKFKKFNDMLDQKRKVQLADYVPNLAKQL